MDLPSRTIENSFNVLNRQIWTNQKEFWKSSARGEESSNQCTLCGGVENTMHLLFECPEYSEIAWELLKETLNTVTEANNIVVHSFNVMYNTNIKNLPEKMQKQIQMLIQQYKRNIIYKRYARCTNENLNNIIFDKNRICAHWIILCKKFIAYKAYQGKDKKVIEKIKEAFENMI